jgi:hypothetical protein
VRGRRAVRAKDVKRQGAVRAEGYAIKGEGGFLPVRGKPARAKGQTAVRRGRGAEGGRR